VGREKDWFCNFGIFIFGIFPVGGGDRLRADGLRRPGVTRNGRNETNGNGGSVFFFASPPRVGNLDSSKVAGGAPPWLGREAAEGEKE